MGIYSKWYIDVNTNDIETLSAIRNYGSMIEGRSFPTNWDEFCFRKWSLSTKWDPTYLMKKISQEFDALIFSVSSEREYAYEKDFYYRGNKIEESLVFPPNPAYPTVSVLKKAIKTRNTKTLADKIAYEKTLVTKFFEDKQKRINELEDELRKLNSE